jgi:hypothetical protein
VSVTFDPKISGRTDITDGTPGTGGSAVLPGDLPPVGSGTGQKNLLSLNLPILPPSSLGGISLEVLVEAIGAKERQTAVQSGLQALKTNADARDKANAEKMKKIKENLETLEKKAKLKPVLKAFKILGMILGAIAAVASLVIGIVTVNPLLIAGGAILTVMTANSILSEASDGKYSISAGIAAAAEKLGADKSTAQWIGMGFELALTITGCAFTLGGSFGAAGAKALEAAAKSAEISGKVMQIAGITAKVSAVAGGISSIGTGVAQGVDAGFDYWITTNKAEQKELQAIMERITQSTAMETDFIEAMMKRTAELLEQVTRIVKENIAAQTTLLTGATPGAA